MSELIVSELSLLLRHAGRRVLLIEDNPLNREVTGLLLSKVGLKVDATKDGQTAMDLAASQTYDLIITDLAMPGLDGVETGQRIRALPGYANTPIIALSACVFGEDRDYCLSGGLNDFIAKPVTATRLYETVLRWLDDPAPGFQAALQGASA
ncbi:MAG: response regulator [Azonexus sp.]